MFVVITKEIICFSPINSECGDTREEKAWDAASSRSLVATTGVEKVVLRYSNSPFLMEIKCWRAAILVSMIKGIEVFKETGTFTGSSELLRYHRRGSVQ